MEITEVRIKLMDEPGERLKAFCSITFDNCFVVRDLKIIEGSNGPFVAMPSRKLTIHCSRCGMKNHLRSQYCNQCGSAVSGERMPLDADGRAKLYADIAHPINSVCREMIQEGVIRQYKEELKQSKLPGYTSRYDDHDLDYKESAQKVTRPNVGESRVDQPHGQPSLHVPNTGGSSEHTSQGPHRPAPPAGQSHSVQDEDGFGTGIFPDR